MLWQVIPGIYLGAHEAAVAEVMTGGLQQNDFRFFAGCLAWEPGQLQREVAAGAWHTAACSRSLVLKQCLQVGAGVALAEGCSRGEVEPAAGGLPAGRNCRPCTGTAATH